MTNPTVLAIIPARGGSKRLPRKNILPLCHKPLLNYSIDAAKHSSWVTDILVTSDDTEICHVASQQGLIVVNRPESLALDTVSNEYVIAHAVHAFMNNHDMPDYIVLLQPTSPLRDTVHLDACLKQYFSSKMRSTMSVCSVTHHPGKYLKIKNYMVEPYTSLEDVEKRIQDLPVVYRQNGAIYALKTKDFLQTLTFYQPPCIPYVMPVEDSVDIDSKLDFDLCELLLKNKTEKVSHVG